MIRGLVPLIGVERPGGPRAVQLTAAGELLLGHAEAIVARLDSARADLRALAEGESGALRVGCYQSVGSRLRPRVVREFRTAWPQVRIELTEAETTSSSWTSSRVASSISPSSSCR